jgi:hypothetical protein
MKLLQQAAFSAGGIILVDDPFFRSTIQFADRLTDSRLAAVFANGIAGRADGGPRPASDDAVADAFAFIAADALDG